MLDILMQNPIVFILVALALIVSLSFHEFAHAYVADKLGDPTPRYLGRVTLNPKAHLDPLGTIFLLLLGFGWGKPVPFNPANLAHPKRDSALIAFAGPFSNFAIALLVALLLKFVPLPQIIGAFLYFVVIFNLTLGFFNLIPIHPLDGFKVVYGLLPLNLAVQWQQMEQFGVYILILLVMTRSTGNIISPLVASTAKILGL